MKPKEHIILQLAIQRGFLDPEVLRVLQGERTPERGRTENNRVVDSQLEMLIQEGILTRKIVDQLTREAENWPAQKDTMPSHPGADRAHTPSRSGLRIGHFEIIKFLGAGGMGRVYQVLDPVRGQVLALKVLKEDDALLRQRFLREAKAQAQVEHPNICRIHETGTADGQAYIAMEYIEGITLDQAKGLLNVTEKVDIIRQAALAIDAAHQVNLIHRDIKPNNIMLAPLLSGGWKPYIMDFGLAREQEAAGITRSGDIMGTPQYMSPEQARGETRTLDSRTDIYSLGATLYELLTGQAPVGGENPVAVVMNLLNGDPPDVRKLNPGISSQLEAVVMKCLARNPAHRYESARALAADLDKYLEGTPVDAETPPRATVRRGDKRTSVLRWAALSLLFLAAVLILAIGIVTHRPGDQPAAPLPAEPAATEPVAIDSLLAAAEAALNDGRLLPPEPNNAYALARRVREQDKGNEQAAGILQRARRASLARIDQRIRSEEWTEAAELLAVHERSFAEDPAVSPRRQEIQARGQAQPAPPGGDPAEPAPESVGEQALERVQRGMAEFRKGNYAKAVDQFQAALEQDPRLVDAYFYLGVCYRVMERPEAAREMLTMVLQMDSRYTMAYLHLGLLFAGDRQYTSAARYLEKVAELGGAPEFTVSRIENLLDELEVRAEFLPYTDRPMSARHERFLGGPTGRLFLTEDTLHFRADENGQSFSFPLRSLEDVTFQPERELVFRYQSRKYTLAMESAAEYAGLRRILPAYLAVHRDSLLEALPRFPGIRTLTFQ